MFLIGTAVGGYVSAAVVLDQQLPLSNGFAVEFDDNQELRQSFTVGTAGLVSKVGVQIFRLNDSLDTSAEVTIGIGSAALPMTVLYGVRIPVSQIPVLNSMTDPVPWTYVDLSRGKRLAQVGSTYGINVSQTSASLDPGATTVYWRASGSANSYPSGNLVRRVPPYSPSNVWANFGDGDGGFQTYVETAAVRKTVSFTPVFDVQAEASVGGAYTLSDGGSQIVNNALSPPNYAGLEQRGMMEFDLRALPADALITAAYLDLDVASFVPGSKSEGFSHVSVAGYGGNGVPDASKAALTTPALEDRTVQALGINTFYLDVHSLESILAGSPYLGLVTRALPSQYPSSYYTSEAASAGGVFAPTLRLEYITALLPGDQNGDGAVDSADFVVGRKYGGPLWSQQDWRANYGALNASGQGAQQSYSAVPEPATLVLALLSVAPILRRRRTDAA